MLDTSINVKIDSFDGPLALLLHLVQKQEMNIHELDLTRITQQYLDYLDKMEELNFNIAGDYLFLASTLVLMKSKVCLSEDDYNNLKNQFDDESEALYIPNREELAKRLEQLQKFQELSKKLWLLERKDEHVFSKPKIKRKEIIDSFLLPLDLGRLSEAMIYYLVKEKRKSVILRSDTLSIKDKLKALKELLIEGQSAEFQELVERDGDKEDIQNIVITFISLLELARLKKIKISQEEEFSKILIDVISSLKDFDINQADGFVPENTQAEHSLQ